jgi:imidazolonepropionase-like amidohydrolase
MQDMITRDRSRRTAVRAAWLFDGTSERLRPDPIVLIDGATIAAVEFGVEPPQDADVVDLGGTTLLPGLVDPHVHLAFDASTSPVANLAARDDDAVLEAMTGAARAAALGGVTTVRDLGDRDYLSLRLRGRSDLPTILGSGPPMTFAGGHCHFLGGTVEPGEESVRAAVRERAERGVDAIKVMASGGNLTPNTRQEEAQFTQDELRALVEEAHRHGLPVAAHVHAAIGVANAVAAGVDSLEHATFWTADGVEAPANVMAEIVERRVVVSVTLGLASSPIEGAGPPPQAAARLPMVIANMRRLTEAGAVMVVGTDAGVGPPKPHDVLRYAPAMMAAIGMSPARSLRTITSGAAEVIGLGSSKGRLSPGYDADILAVNGDPMADPATLHEIRAVFVRGSRLR